MVKEFLNNYFGFNRQQRNGLVVLMCISAFLLIVRVTYPSFMTPPHIQVMNIPVVSTGNTSDETTEKATTLFYFDPNTAAKEELIKLGLKEKTATTLIKYRKKNPFKSAGDLRKIYGLSPALLEKIEPYVQFEELLQPPVQEPQAKPSPSSSLQVKNIELNGADSIQLTGLSGIGPAFAHRIIKYRTMLGGFVMKEQLKEVYGLKQETYDKVSPHVYVDASMAKKVNLNEDDFKTVNRHPYISYELTKELFNRKRKEPLNAGLVRQIVGNDSLYQRLLPYLAF
jgi:competence protein ComEA